MGMLIKKAGILTTVQDLGREGYSRLGINPGGVLDRAAARLLNVLVGNEEGAALIETHFPAVEVQFDSKCEIAVGGADLTPCINGREVSNWTVHTIAKGDVLKFRAKRLGNRAYIAVSGGVKVPEWLGSSSTNLRAVAGGFDGRRLVAGDAVKIGRCGNTKSLQGKAISHSLRPCYGGFPKVRVIDGGESFLLSKDTRKTFTTSPFKVTPESDRMGFRLSGPKLPMKKNYEMVTSAAAFGTVQLLPDGQLVVLMADHQTTGGYPRIATLISADLPLLAQLGPGDKLTFDFVTIDEAESLSLDFERDLNLLKLALNAR